MATARGGTPVVLAALAALAAAGWWLHGRTQRRVPARIRLEERVADLGAAFRHADVSEERVDDPVRMGGIQPGDHFSAAGAYRAGIVAPAPARIRFRLRVPPRAKLAFAIGIERKDSAASRRAAIRFSVEVDGRRRFARTLARGTRHAARGWVETAVDLGVEREREVEIALRTEAIGDASGIVPAWSHVRVLRDDWRERQAPGPGAPNVLVVLVDALRAEDLGCYGARPSPSPALDRFAAGGRLFEQAAAQAPWTLPAVASLFTGRYPTAHGVVGVRQRAAGTEPRSEVDRTFLDDAIPTFAEEASRAGITTIAVSANPLVSRRTNLSRGFETFVELERAKEPRGWRPARDVNAAFLAWLAANRDRRFLGYLHYMDVHGPYTPRPPHQPPPPPGIRPAIAAGQVAPFALAIELDGAAPPPAPEVAYLHRLYVGEIAGWDEDFADLLRGLDRAGVLDATVVVVLADHGEEFGEHGMLSHGSHLYEKAVRIPFVVAGPGIAPGRTAAQVQGIDLFPTLAALMGFRVPPDLHGDDVLAAPATRPAFIETVKGRTRAGTETPLVAVRLPGWKLIHAPTLAEYELYDLASDPEERRNVFTEADAAARLRALIADWQAGVQPAPAPARATPGVFEKLRELGYVQ
ncbi:MAG TPA: sulfatase [Candidatus Binatia bacterium]|nr:sulfatase [Candidatus Binatia bacterium]